MVDVGVHLKSLCAALVSSSPFANRIALSFNAARDCLTSPESAITIGLIVGEAITNSIKHAHPAGVRGRVKVTCGRTADDGLLIDVVDDGVGFPEAFDPSADGDHGLKLMRRLASRIGAQIGFTSTSLGLRVRLSAPAAHPDRLFGVMDIPTDVADRQDAEDDARRLASIVEFSDDAIISKNLDGVITSWNRGAQDLFGYTAEEAIGQPVTLLIPPARLDEEPQILARIRRGEQVNNYETVRRRKDGELLEISLTVSPIKNSKGEIVGASKIARDITDRRRAEERRDLLLREMDHRVKNLLTLAGGIVSLSARGTNTPSELARTVRDRFAALARAHNLTLSKASDGSSRSEKSTSLHRLIETVVSPFVGEMDEDQAQVVIHGPDIAVSGGAITNLALLIHEFTTNAAKYGALSVSSGRINIDCSEMDGRLLMTWRELGGPPVPGEPDTEGFGSLLARMTMKGQLSGELSREWKPEGLTINLSVALDHLTA
jgi:PAS domain S-box-containing protein